MNEDKPTERRRLRLMAAAMLLMAAVVILRAFGEHGWTVPKVALLVGSLGFLVLAGAFALLGYRQSRSTSEVTGHE